MKLGFSQTSQEQGVGCSGNGPLGVFSAGPHDTHILSSTLRPTFPQSSHLCDWRRTRQKQSVSHIAPSAVSQKMKALVLKGDSLPGSGSDLQPSFSLRP